MRSLAEFIIRCLCVGPTGVGLSELKKKLLISDPQHFSVTIPRKFVVKESLGVNVTTCVNKG